MIFFKNFFNFKLRFLTNGVTQKGRVCACLKAHFMLFKKRAGVIGSKIYRLEVMGHLFQNVDIRLSRSKG